MQSKIKFAVKKALFKILSKTNLNFQFHVYSLLNKKAPNKKTKKNVLILAPEAGLKSHYLPLLQIGNSLQNNGFECFVTQCKAIFTRCPLHGAYGIPPYSSQNQRKSTCIQCINKSFYLPSFFNIQSIQLGSSPEKQDKINKLIKKYKKKLTKIKYDKIPFGKICEHDFRVYFKKISYSDNEINKNKIQKKSLINLISSSIRNYLEIKDILKKIKFEKVIYYNDYSLFIPIRLLFEKRKNQAFTITHAYNRGIDRGKIIISKKLSFFETLSPQRSSKAWITNPLPPGATTEIFEDILWRLTGKSFFTYSPPKTLNNNTHEYYHKKIITAFSSSPDETSCLRVLSSLYPGSNNIKFLFGTSFENCQKNWIEFLKMFASKNKELLIQFRVHPREHKNKRDTIISEHFKIIKKALKNKPKNLKVIWPGEPKSSYDLVENSSLILTAWSSLGYEMARLGVPLITCTDGYASSNAKSNFVSCGTVKQYEESILKEINYNKPFQYMRIAFRWWHKFYLERSITMYNQNINDDLKIQTKVSQTAEKSIIKIIEGKKITFLKHANSKHNEKGEIEEYIKNIPRVLYFLNTGIEPNNEIILKNDEKEILFSQKNDSSTYFKFRKKFKSFQMVKNGSMIDLKSKINDRLLNILNEVIS